MLFTYRNIISSQSKPKNPVISLLILLNLILVVISIVIFTNRAQAASLHLLSCNRTDTICFHKLTVSKAFPPFLTNSLIMTSLESPVPAYILISVNNQQILAGKNIDISRPIASVSKLMTAVVSSDLLSSGTYFPVSKNAASQPPTKLGMKVNQEFTLDELMPAMLLTSANDAASVLAEAIDTQYGPGAFLNAANIKAKFLGLTNTHFSNPQGFDEEGNYSSPRDLATMATYIITNYSNITSLTSVSSKTINSTFLHTSTYLHNWNGLLGVYSGTLGLKTGFTPKAGRTAVYAAKRNGQTLVVVILGASSQRILDTEAAKLFDYGFDSIFHLAPEQISDQMLTNKYLTWPTK